MARKTYLDRLKRKFGFVGEKYRKVVSKIIAYGTGKVGKAVAKKSGDNYDKTFKKLGKKDKRIILPRISDVVPPEDVFIRKAETSGRLITDSLRDQLRDNLKEVLEDSVIRERGTLAGTMNPDAEKIFQEKIGKTFENYTKKDPRYGVPSNIRTIAVTEIRSTINNVKDAYVQRLMQEHPEAEVNKKWIHNPHLSKEPRYSSHGVAGRGKAIPFNQNFVFPASAGKGKISMMYPHDPSAPLSETIGCHCELEYRVKLTGKSAKPVMKQLAAAEHILEAMRKNMVGQHEKDDSTVYKA